MFDGLEAYDHVEGMIVGYGNSRNRTRQELKICGTVFRTGMFDGLFVNVDPNYRRGGIGQHLRTVTFARCKIEHALSFYKCPGVGVPVQVLISN